MFLSFLKPYKSIYPFDTVTLSTFSLFVGRNGAGKTQLLKAIETGHVVFGEIDQANVVYFNLQSFYIRNQNHVTLRSLEEERAHAWNTFEQWRSNKRLSKSPSEIKSMIKAHTDDVKQRALLETGINSGVDINLIDKNNFFKNSHYVPDDYYLLKSLSEICVDYKRKYLLAQLPIILGGEGLSTTELDILEKNSPWNFINEMFNAFGLPHKVIAPDFTAGDIVQNGTITYKITPIIDEVEIDFDDLSSGERILCALAITVFQDRENSNFPKLLLLDEVDASLHPSMIKDLLRVIDEVFLKHGCNVILATHSPATAALVPEETVYEIRSGRMDDKIVKISKGDAVELLSEGIMSLEKGLVLLDQISAKPLTIFTEGNNTIHLRTAISVIKPRLLSAVDIVTGVEGSSGKDQLKVLFNFFKHVKHATAVLFVFDCDVTMPTKVEENQTYIFIFDKNEKNTFATKGIENVYPESIFTGYLKQEIDSHKVETLRFDPKRKNDFGNRIASTTDPASFNNYKPLIEKIESILKK